MKTSDGKNVTNSVKCFAGWQLSISSALKLSADLCDHHDFKFVFTRRLHQDALENFFCHQTKRRIVRQPNAGTFVPKNFRSRERKFHRVELSFPWNFRSLELSLPGTKVPWNFRFLGLSFPGTFAPRNFRSLPRTVALRVNFLIGLTIVNINVRCRSQVLLITTVTKY